MRYGQLIAPKDLPARTDNCSGALTRARHDAGAARQRLARARARRACAALSRFLETSGCAGRSCPSTARKCGRIPSPIGAAGRSRRRARPARAGMSAKSAGISATFPCRWGRRPGLDLALQRDRGLRRGRASFGRALVYALCRPSGHHARADRARASAISTIRRSPRSGCARVTPSVAILDVDAHHGDGTQQIFYNRADI